MNRKALQTKASTNHKQKTAQLRSGQRSLSSSYAPSVTNIAPSPLPAHLRTSIESISGTDLSMVRVYKNSPEPEKLNALAYALGTDIHLAPGEEKHLAHEAWHTVQQLQGRVNPTTRKNGIPVNDDRSLENEADVMGKKSLQKREHTDISGSVFDNKENTNSSDVVSAVPQLTLQEDVNNNLTIGLSELISAYDGESGVIARQKQAVNDFTDAVQVDDPPSVSEQILIGAINLALGAALGSIGTTLKAIGRRALRPALLAATRATFNTAVDSSQVRSSMRSSLDSAIDAMTAAGKSKISTAVTASFNGSAGDAPTPALKFRAAQEHALTEIGRAQTRAIHMHLSELFETEGTEDEWAVMNALYSAFQEGLSSAYDSQYNKMTDVWFAMQTTSIGLGARPGVLQIELASRYPHKGSFRISDGNLVGEGSNSTIRSRLSGRPLKEIGIPKIIRMNGSMGYGILDIMWNITVTGEERRSSQPAFRAPDTRTRAEFLMATEQHVTRIGGNRWGPAWLAAYHLGLSDLDTDDPRNNDENQARGALSVWNEVKDMQPGSIGNSTW
ncbi:MAG TPA: DUF4157 domain-containing protein [Gammaproteobacteria bacterium]|nr:DUF4157 domain-containing protein [Gammaproteobacteria bacterium]